MSRGTARRATSHCSEITALFFTYGAPSEQITLLEVRNTELGISDCVDRSTRSPGRLAADTIIVGWVEGFCPGVATEMLRVATRAINPGGVVEVCAGDFYTEGARLVADGASVIGDSMSTSSLEVGFGASIYTAGDGQTISDIAFHVPELQPSGSSAGIRVEAATTNLLIERTEYFVAPLPARQAGEGIDSTGNTATGITVRDSFFHGGADAGGQYPSIFPHRRGRDHLRRDDRSARPDETQIQGIRVVGDNARIENITCGDPTINAQVSRTPA